MRSLAGMSLFDSRIKATVEVERLARLPTGRLPISLNDVIKRIRPKVKEMLEEAPDWVVHQSAVFEQSINYLMTVPGSPQAHIGMNTCCSGAGVVVSGSIVYYMEKAPAYSPDDWYRRYGDYPKIYIATPERTEVILKQDRLGRAGGLFGWSKDRNLVAGALASFTHNFVEALIAFVERPRLPQTRDWILPNLTLSETKKPEQFHPPASYSYAVARPAFNITFDVRVSSETPVELGFEWWDAYKNDLARVESVKVDAGDNRILAMLRGPPLRIRRGYFTINVLDAPKGLTITSVSTYPVSV